jgi:hypothetical protein
MLNGQRYRPNTLPTRPHSNVDAQRLLLPTRMSARPTGTLSASRSNAQMLPHEPMCRRIPKPKTKLKYGTGYGIFQLDFKQ